jgi:hypothetical protein
LDRPITALTEGKIAIATSQGYFMELLCRYWKIRKPFMSSGTMGRPISILGVVDVEPAKPSTGLV